jgi:hypothetical protein
VNRKLLAALASDVTIYRMKRIACTVILFVVLFPSFSHAWGGDGHQIVCLIAEDHLTPAAKAGIHDLLGKDVNISDAEIASWADQVRRERKATGPWHYVDIPVDAQAFDEARDGKRGSNVIDKINDFKAVLKNPNASKSDRAEALKFLVHFVGDRDRQAYRIPRQTSLRPAQAFWFGKANWPIRPQALAV